MHLVITRAATVLRKLIIPEAMIWRVSVWVRSALAHRGLPASHASTDYKALESLGPTHGASRTLIKQQAQLQALMQVDSSVAPEQAAHLAPIEYDVMALGLGARQPAATPRCAATDHAERLQRAAWRREMSNSG
eukprot:gene29710-35868_t